MLYQNVEIVYANEIWGHDELYGCLFDPLVITTYLGKHTIGCSVTMLGEDHGTSVVVPRRYVRGMSDLNVLHQEAVAKFLRYDADFVDLEYHDYEQFVSER